MQPAPLGVTPRFIVVEHRLDDINRAITRYVNVGLLPLQEWLDERLELMEWLDNRMAGYAQEDNGFPEPPICDCG